MDQADILEAQQGLASLCDTVRSFVKQKNYQPCLLLIEEAIGKYPHAPEPHNLLGLLLEAQGEHIAAMKHFRAAWALDPTYLPTRQNLDYFGSCYPSGKWAYNESDCPQEYDESNYRIDYDERGIGHVAKNVR